jgi:hypothetical protein
MLQVQDGSRILQFEGDLIGQSSSFRRGNHRWVEFYLYKTREEGRYVLSRIGVSTLFHHPDCEIAQRNKLKDAPYSTLDEHAVPCTECRPDLINFPIVAPEKNRNWAQVCDTAHAVLEALTKYDAAGSWYLTYVAQRLLEDASEHDEDIAAVYKVETIH